MQSRKKQNLEVERKLKRQKKKYLAVFAALCLVVVIAIGWVVWDTLDRRYIMTFNGERIATGDFRFISILEDVPINEFTRYDILRELKTYVTLMQMADRLGVGYTPEEQVENEAAGEMWRGIIEQNAHIPLGFIDDRRIGEFMNFHALLVPRLIDLVIYDYEVTLELDEDMFAEELGWHIEWLVEQGTEVLVKYMALYPWEDHVEVAIELADPEGFDFDDIASRFCVLGTGLEPININDFATQYGVPIDDWLAGLPIGQFSPQLQGNEYDFFFYIYGRREPELDLEDVTQEFRENYELNIRRSIFSRRLEEWIEEAEYELNLRVFNTIS